MELQIEGLPDGFYDAELISIEELPPSKENPDWGPSARISLMVIGGDLDGTVATDNSGKRPGPKARFGKLLRGIINREPTPGERIDLAQYYGKRYKLTAEVDDKGRSRFTKLLAIPDPAAKACQPEKTKD